MTSEVCRSPASRLKSVCTQISQRREHSPHVSISKYITLGLYKVVVGYTGYADWKDELYIRDH